MNGKVYVFGRSGEGATKQERVACFDAGSGDLLWEHYNNVYNTAVPYKRVAWASMAGDPETGNVYAIGGGGLFFCFSENGKVLWERSMTDEFNVRTGFGGRTVSPIVDEDLVIIAFVSSSWGSHAAPFMRYYAFEKKTGDIRWISAPGGRFTNPNIYSTPVIATINGRRLLIGGNADGNVYAINVRTGEKIWQFDLGKRGLHSSVVVDGNIVYAAHGEENLDNPVMGRVVAIDATGSGNVTKTHELWRIDGAEVGFTSLLVKDGRLYFVDNTAKLYAVDAKTGHEYWNYDLGTVGKASPVWADGKIYYPEVNGRFQILKPGENECESLDLDHVTVPDGRYAELYGSPAIAYGRIYFVSEEGLYCLGNKSQRFAPERSTMAQTDWRAPGDSKVSKLQVVPADITVMAGERIKFKVRGLDDIGRFVREITPQWNAAKLPVEMNKNGELMIRSDAASQVGMLEASFGELKGDARIRIFSNLPWNDDFESLLADDNYDYWLGAGSARSPASKFIAKKINDNTVIVKPIAQRGVQNGITYIGPPGLTDYTIQADVMSEKAKRKVSDIGLINCGYTVEMMGAKQRIEISSWTSELRVGKTLPFRWEAGVWYTLKLKVQSNDRRALIQAKAWPKGDPEPSDWNISVEDPLPIKAGTPGLSAFSKTEVYFDNLMVTKN